MELQLLTGPKMLLYIERSFRGGISQCSNRYAKENNPYMGINFEYFSVLLLTSYEVHLSNSKLYHVNYFLSNDLYFHILKTRRSTGKVVEKEN